LPTKVGYARCSTIGQDLTAQREQLGALGVAEERIYTDHGLSGRNRERPGLDKALAAVREGDTFVVTKLDRLARSVPDARDIVEQLSSRGVLFAMGNSVYDWTNPNNKLFLNLLAMVAEFESDLIRQRTREGMAIARSRGRLKGRQPSLSPAQQRELLKMYEREEHTVVELAEIFRVSRPTVYRVIARSLTEASGSPAGLNDRRPSRPRRATVPGALPQALPPTGPDEPEVLSSQQELFDPPRLLSAPEVRGDESVNAMGVDGVRDQDTPKGANVPSYVSDAYYENEALADAIEKKIGEGGWRP
jgi:DNA invertase Pin-like site-specific DNA recombinase